MNDSIVSKANVSSQDLVKSVDIVPSKRPQEVLDEDTYTETISYLVERDFFPNLTKIKKQNELIDSLDTTDINRISTVTRSIKQGRYLDTPRRSDSPLPKFPSKEDLEDRKFSHLKNISLDDFQAKFTSEDNASFLDLLDKNNEEKRQKYKYLYQKEAPTLAIEDQKMKQIEPSSSTGFVESWKYKTKNSLMYYPEGSYESDKSEERGESKAIAHKNTRFESVGNAGPSFSRNTDRSITSDMTSESGSDSPRVRGYGFVTPSPRPEELGIFPWDLEGIPSESKTPVFKLPPTPRRELIAMKLSEKASRNHRKQTQASPRANALRTPTRMGSPSLSMRSQMLSPAAQKLLKNKLHIDSSFNSHQEIRESYGGLTPKLNGSKSSIRSNIITPKRVEVSTPLRTSITDDLLEFKKKP
ncbi:hypothetical protein K7432_002506 [Basidiobolus ranarum]|uniref:DGCR14 n=1 Tax=Basidiobolus ranarum TaxID=34480 RepID=A0ABR2W7Y5_9FUNG